MVSDKAVTPETCPLPAPPVGIEPTTSGLEGRWMPGYHQAFRLSNPLVVTLPLDQD